MAATARPVMPGNQMPGPAPGPPTSPLAAAPPRPGSTPPSPTTLRQLSPTRPLSGFGFGAKGASLRSSVSLSRPGRPTISIFGGSHNDSSSNSLDRRQSLSATVGDHRLDRGSWSASSSASASGSKTSSFIGTPHLSRRGSAREQREKERPPLIGPARSMSVRGKRKDDEQLRSATSETDARSLLSDGDGVTETPQLRLQRDPETGKKMINQYIVMQEIGHGTHGRVRLGRDTSVDNPSDDLEADLATGTGSGSLYAIKIVERNPKKKRLAGLGRQRGRNEGKRVAENEIRKEIAIFKKVHHPNVVRMKEIIDDPESSKLFMILEYCEGGEVRWKGANGGPALSLAETRVIFRDTLLGLEYLHHQGIIHRDIKPSNLLISGDKVKIADFGCSHFSEALYAAQGNEGEAYVDDVELAKTAGSPAFFAPEMCYSEVDEVSPPPPTPQPSAEDVPTLTLRPPSALIEKPMTPLDTVVVKLPAETVVKRPADDPSRPDFDRTESAATLPRTKPRHPITNAIDVWALGVTLYCLLFGKTPFDAPNEYLLMQVIPTLQYPIPATMGSNQLPTGANAPEEVKEALDLLSRLLEKDAMKRISLEQAKRHPFTIRDLPDPQGWLESTDPHAQSRVTVTHDEVTAAVTKGGLRERFKKHFKTISTRLGFLGGRGRSQSVTADGDPTEFPSDGSRTVRKAGSHTADQTLVSPVTAPSGSSIARRFSIMNRDRSRGGSHGALGAEPPRPGLLAAALDRAGTGSPMPPLSPSPVIVEDSGLQAPESTVTADSTPRQLPSMASLDKIRAEASASPIGRRRPSTVEAEHSRPRSASNASSSGSIFSAIGRGIFSRENSKRGSHRSNGHPVMKTCYSYGSDDAPDNVFASSIDSHPAVFSSSVNDGPGAEFLLRNRSMDMGRRSVETFESGSPGSLNGHHLGPSPERLHTFESRFRGAERGMVPRRGSTLSEDIRPVMEDEEVDWEGDVPDSDDECVSEEEEEDDGLPAGHGITSAPADWNLAAALDEIERKQLKLSPANSPVRGHSLLKPAGGLDLGRLGSKQSLASHTSFASQQSSHSTISSNPSSTTQFRAPPSAYRAKSPLGETPAYSFTRASPLETAAEPATPTGTSTPDCFLDAEDDDDGLVLGLRRGRKGSTLSRQSSSMGRSPPPAHPRRQS